MSPEYKEDKPAKVTNKEIGIMGMVAYGFSNEEIDYFLPLLDRNTAETLIEQYRVIPNSWKALGFSIQRPPMKVSEWEKVITSSNPASEGHEGIREAAEAASDYWTERVWRQKSGIDQLRKYYMAGLITFEEVSMLMFKKLDELGLLFPKPVKPYVD